MNTNHSPTDGKFSTGRSVGGPRSLAHLTDRQLAASSHPLHKAELKRRQSENKPVYLSAKVEEFYNHVHDHATGRFSGRAASGRAGFREGSHGPGKVATTGVSRSGGLPQVATVRRSGAASFKESATSVATPHNFPRGDQRRGPVHTTGTIARKAQDIIKSRSGHAVVGPKSPFRNAVTGRINPTQVREAFKTGSKSGGSKRTTLSDKVSTSKTVKGRVIRHESNGGGPAIGRGPANLHNFGPHIVKKRFGWEIPEKAHSKTVKAQLK